MQTLLIPELLYDGRTFREHSAVLYEGQTILAVGAADDLQRAHPDAHLLHWPDTALMPGTVNAHNHSFQSLLRGIAVDEPFLAWRDQALYKYSPRLDEEAAYAGALLAFGEMLQYGVTTVVDFFYVHNGGNAMAEAVIRAAQDLGMRIVLARTMYDWPGAPAGYQESVADAYQRTRDLAIRYSGHPSVTVHPAPHSPHAASPSMIQAGHRLARELGTPFHIHVAEEPFEVEEILRDHGVRPVHYLDRLGVLDDSMIAIHLVWLDDSEVSLLGSRGCALAYCPSSNMFLADGITRVPDLMRAGVKVMLGTDGGCSNNRISVFEEMRMAALLQKVANLDATSMRAVDTFAMGTSQAGDILRLPIGRIAPGFLADFTGVDLGHLSLYPRSPDRLLSHVVYAMQSDAVKHVIVGGRALVRDRERLTVSADHIRRAVQATGARIGLFDPC